MARDFASSQTRSVTPTLAEFAVEARAFLDVNAGWSVFRTTLQSERASIGSRGAGYGGSGLVGLAAPEKVVELARHFGLADDPVVRRDLARLYTGFRLVGWNASRRPQLGQRPVHHDVVHRRRHQQLNHFATAHPLVGQAYGHLVGQAVELGEADPPTLLCHQGGAVGMPPARRPDGFGPHSLSVPFRDD